MFLKSIHIKDSQFDLYLDLTYPKGHAKVGKPLDKICIIGDNGTGKTTLLELVLQDYKRQANIPIFENLHNVQYDNEGLDFQYSDNILLKNNIFKLLYYPKGIDHLNLDELQKKFDENTIKNSRDLGLHDVYKFIHDLTDGKELLRLWYELRANLTQFADEYLHDEYEKFARLLNKILNKFHLELNPDIELQKFSEMEFIELKAKGGTVLPTEKWSAGIKQLIYTTLPLYYLKSQEGIIMIDEPESSLHPNTQHILIDFYKSVGTKMQLIFATHSPIIASSFEPWEVIELQFNNEGKVIRKLYYEGENHVDNYNTYPMYLRWDSLYTNLFGVVGQSNDERLKKLEELAILDREMKLAEDDAEKKELFKKYESIAEKLDWATL